MTSTQTKFDVGGVLLDRPFKVRRLGHFGFNVEDVEAGRHFYSDLLGFKVSDVSQRGGYFMRYGGDHHAFVLFRRGAPANPAMSAVAAPGNRTDVTINQITWQTGSLAEVGNAARWFKEEGVPVRRTGRDMPGSNWHTYLFDPDGQSNELYYGIEQIGWNGHSKPRAMYDRGFDKPPELPQISEFDEVQQAKARGIDPTSGYRHADNLAASYDVDGILLPRPFKIVRLGPVSLFVDDVANSEAFYREKLGFTLTEEVLWQGHRCLFLRCNTEHHSLALFPIALRQVLGFSAHTKSAGLGLQLANYRQLNVAVRFLKERGIKVREDIPTELHPGIDCAVHVLDPDGHMIQLYCAMEQIGWDGKPRPKELRRPLKMIDWPATLDGDSNVYLGEPFLGPWG